MLCESGCEDLIRRSGAIGQLGFFDAEKQLAALSEKGDPLEAIAALVGLNGFAVEKSPSPCGMIEGICSKAGRMSWLDGSNKG